MTTSDVIIVGGGPAGSTCARELVAAGAGVRIVDRATFPRDKCCAGWITPQVTAVLGLDVERYGREHTIQPLSGFTTGAIGHTSITTRFDRTVSYAIRRVEFDHHLLERSGAAVTAGTPVQRIERRRDRWVVNGEFEAPLLIGAGGHFCPVARHVNPRRDDANVVAAQEIEVRMTAAQAARCRVDPEVPDLYFCPDRRGYGWCVRKGEFLNVGFGRMSQGDFANQLRAFQAFLFASNRIPGDLPHQWPGHAYRLWATPRRRLVDDGVMLVGDAGGLAHPVSGEGILAAVESGVMGARVALSAGGRFDRATLGEYEAQVVRRYGRPGPAPGRVSWLPQGVSNRVGARLMATTWFARRILLERWFLHEQARPLNA